MSDDMITMVHDRADFRSRITDRFRYSYDVARYMLHGDYL
jgi:hypothetical protein